MDGDLIRFSWPFTMILYRSIFRISLTAFLAIKRVVRTLEVKGKQRIMPKTTITKTNQAQAPKRYAFITFTVNFLGFL